MRLNNIKSQVSTITKQLTQTVRWWCGGGAVGTARVGKASGWRLAVGGWFARWRSGGGELKKPQRDVRIHTAPEGSQGQRRRPLLFFLYVFLFVFPFFLFLKNLSAALFHSFGSANFVAISLVKKKKSTS